MKEIPLTQGKVALVDAADYELVSARNWCAVRRNQNWYAQSRFDGRVHYLHRFLMDEPTGAVVHHRNGDSLDNRRENLFVGTQKENMQGIRRKGARATSRFRGVCWNTDCNKWVAQIQRDGRVCYLGLFESEGSAAKAYDSAAREMFGSFAAPNFQE